MPLSSSVGGGRGFYKNVDGDRPIAMLNAVTLDPEGRAEHVSMPVSSSVGGGR